MYTDNYFNRFVLPEDLKAALQKSRYLVYPESKEELMEMAYGPTHSSRYDVCYPIEGKGLVKEAEVVRCKNGTVVNFMEDYMRRRDPDCMRIGDDLPTDKPRFKDVYGYDFADLRKETMAWFETQGVILLPFHAGGKYYGYDALMVCPTNAAFFALSLANMQGFVSINDVEDGFIVVRVGVMNDDSEFDGEAYGWARCTVTAYVPKKTRGRLNKELYKTFEDGINGIIKQEQQAQGEYYIATDGVVSLDNDETAQQGNQYHVFIKSFLVVIDQPKEQQQE